MDIAGPILLICSLFAVLGIAGALAIHIRAVRLARKRAIVDAATRQLIDRWARAVIPLQRNPHERAAYTARWVR